MRVLITNDDGINAVGLKILAEIAKKFFDVFVAAPAIEQSAKSQSLEIKESFEVIKVEDLLPQVNTYQIHSTSADCVRVSQHYLQEPFDLVFSGINHGYNLGNDIYYSGTVAAATEGVLMGKKCIAFSMDRYVKDIEETKKQVEKSILHILNHSLLDLHSLYNINIPNDAKGIKYTYQSIYNHYDESYKEENKKVKCTSFLSNSTIEEKNSDFFCVSEHYISITPLRVARTEEKIYKTLLHFES